MTDRTSTTEYSLELEDPIPDFDDMPGADGGSYGLSSFDDKPVLVFAFISNGCPMVRAYDGARLISIQKVYGPRGVQVVAINSNNAHLSPIDGYEEVVERAEEAGYNFPYLKDEDGRVARVLEATTTPHVLFSIESDGSAIEVGSMIPAIPPRRPGPISSSLSPMCWRVDRWKLPRPSHLDAQSFGELGEAICMR